MTGYLPVGFEFAAELTYPEPEVITYMQPLLYYIIYNNSMYFIR